MSAGHRNKPRRNHPRYHSSKTEARLPQGQNNRSAARGTCGYLAENRYCNWEPTPECAVARVHSRRNPGYCWCTSLEGNGSWLEARGRHITCPSGTNHCCHYGALPHSRYDYCRPANGGNYRRNLWRGWPRARKCRGVCMSILIQQPRRSLGQSTRFFLQKYSAVLHVSIANNLAYIAEVFFRALLLVVLVFILSQLWK